MTAITIKEGSDSCTVCTDQSRILRRLRKLRSLYPQECIYITRSDGMESWTVPYWWWNCRRRNKPQLQQQNINVNKSEEIE